MNHHPCFHAAHDPDKAALIIEDDGSELSYAELEEQSIRGSQLMRDLGLSAGSRIAIMMENNLHYAPVLWSGLRSGLIVTPISSHLLQDEIEYILRDCGARAFITSSHLADRVAHLPALGIERLTMLMCGAVLPGYLSWEESCAVQPAERIDDEEEGTMTLYSSGSTGRPKGVELPWNRGALGQVTSAALMLEGLFGMGGDTVYYGPAPLYHSGPLYFMQGLQRLGGTVVCSRKFDPERALAAIERYRVTHSQWVPTMFTRLLRLPREIRERYDLSSLEMVLHGAAPCPIETKRRMFEWLGEIIHEHYSATEGIGQTYITPQEWLAHPGSVGRPVLGEVHIVADDGSEAPVGEVGTVFFAGGQNFRYRHDEELTQKARNEQGWATTGDIGYVDEEGFLYLVDRSSELIIAGGVNIYPREAEDRLLQHPAVLDCAVIGVPDAEYGEAVKAVVETAAEVVESEALARELIDYCRQHLAALKCPRSVDFVNQLPRTPAANCASNSCGVNIAMPRLTPNGKARVGDKPLQQVEVFTDGSCKGNPGPGGWGALLRYAGHEREIWGGERDTTNNRMELTAAIKALASLKRPCEVLLVTDSSYLQHGINQWISKWRSNGWKTSAGKAVKNADLWRELDTLSRMHAVRWSWVKAHSGHRENEIADQLAKKGVAESLD